MGRDFLLVCLFAIEALDLAKSQKVGLAAKSVRERSNTETTGLSLLQKSVGSVGLSASTLFEPGPEFNSFQTREKLALYLQHIVESLSSMHASESVVYERERLAAFCFLKKELMQYNELHPLPSEMSGGNKSCAVVSSSGSLLEHRFGSEIDAHDVVIRFNRAPTKGFEESVGSYTTFRLGWDPGEEFQHEFLNLSLFTTEPNQTLKQSETLRQIFPNAKQHGEVARLTSGFRGMLVALSNCGTVDAYEITPSDDGRSSGYSYYGKWRPGKGAAMSNPWHGFFQAEHQLWLKLSTSSEDSVKSTGKSTYPGFNRIHCETADYTSMAKLSSLTQTTTFTA